MTKTLFDDKFASCLTCVHLKKGFKCSAFPNGIPNEIVSGENDHLKPLKGQKNNIVFDLKKTNERDK